MILTNHSLRHMDRLMASLNIFFKLFSFDAEIPHFKSGWEIIKAKQYYANLSFISINMPKRRRCSWKLTPIFIKNTITVVSVGVHMFLRCVLWTAGTIQFLLQFLVHNMIIKCCQTLLEGEPWFAHNMIKTHVWPCAWLLWNWSSRGQLALCNPRGRQAEWVLSSTDRMKISVKKAIQNGFSFLSHT